MRALRALVAAAALALALPGAGWAHAELLRTFPSASGVLRVPPTQVRLVFSEGVEPRFAVVSVTDAAGRRLAAGPPVSAPAGPAVLDVPLRRLARGWYLVWWRVVSDDGHPERGAFTFAVGPRPGPAPRFAVPSTTETAATPRLVALRFVAFLAAMAAIGLFVLRTLIARPLVPRVPGTRLRAVSTAFWIALGVALAAVPVYALAATARFALRSALSLGALLPLLRVSAFGRALLDLELLLALFGVAAAAALWLDRPERERRGAAATAATAGALAAGAAALVAPGAAGHAAQTSPRALALALDWLHLAAGSIWVGGLLGLLVLWRSLPAARRVAGLVVCVPRFSNAALASVLALVGSGIGAALLHLPTFGSLWQTSYGLALLAKICLLLAAVALAAVNLARTRPRLRAPELGGGAASLLRRLVAGEAVLVAGAVAAAAVLTSLPPPARALAELGRASATVGPGPVARTLERGGYRLRVSLEPNRPAAPTRISVELERGGGPVRGAAVTATFTMLEMEMGSQTFRLAETAPGRYARTAPALVMNGRWGITLTVRPPGEPPLDLVLVDHAH